MAEDIFPWHFLVLYLYLFLDLGLLDDVETQAPILEVGFFLLEYHEIPFTVKNFLVLGDWACWNTPEAFFSVVTVVGVVSGLLSAQRARTGGGRRKRSRVGCKEAAGEGFPSTGRSVGDLPLPRCNWSVESQARPQKRHGCC